MLFLDFIMNNGPKVAMAKIDGGNDQRRLQSSSKLEKTATSKFHHTMVCTRRDLEIMLLQNMRGLLCPLWFYGRPLIHAHLLPF